MCVVLGVWEWERDLFYVQKFQAKNAHSSLGWLQLWLEHPEDPASLVLLQTELRADLEGLTVQQQNSVIFTFHITDKVEKQDFVRLSGGFIHFAISIMYRARVVININEVGIKLSLEEEKMKYQGGK